MHRTSSRALRAVAWIALASASCISTAAAAGGYMKFGQIMGENTSSADTGATTRAFDVHMKLKEVKESAAPGSTGGQIEVQSFSWGATQTSAGAQGLSPQFNPKEYSVKKKAGGDPAKEVETIDSAAPADPAAPRGVAKVDAFTIKQSVAADLDGDGQPEVTKTHDKSTPKLAEAQALPTGSLTVAAALPGCAVGTRYVDAELGTGAGRYQLEDVIITSCATDGVSFNYATLRESPTR
jgi:hypothetical protein